MDDVQEGEMEPQGHLGVLHRHVAGTVLQLSNNGPDGIEFLFGVGPQNKRLLQQVQTSFHDLLIIFIVAVVECYFDEEVEAYLCCSVVGAFF